MCRSMLLPLALAALKRKASNEILKWNIKLPFGHCSWTKVLHTLCESVFECVCAGVFECVCVWFELLLWPLCLAPKRWRALGLGESWINSNPWQFNIFSSSTPPFSSVLLLAFAHSEIDVVWLLIYLMVGKGLNSFILPVEHKGCCPLYHCPDWLEWGLPAGQQQHRKKGLVSKVKEWMSERVFQGISKWQMRRHIMAKVVEACFMHGNQLKKS